MKLLGDIDKTIARTVVVLLAVFMLTLTFFYAYPGVSRWAYLSVAVKVDRLTGVTYEYRPGTAVGERGPGFYAVGDREGAEVKAAPAPQPAAAPTRPAPPAP